MMEKLETISPPSFKYEVRDDGDRVFITGGTVEQLANKGLEVYCNILEGEVVHDHQKKEILEMLQKGKEPLRPNGYGIKIELDKDRMYILNQNGVGYQPSRDLMKKAIGY